MHKIKEFMMRLGMKPGHPSFELMAEVLLALSKSEKRETE